MGISHNILLHFGNDTYEEIIHISASEQYSMLFFSCVETCIVCLESTPFEKHQRLKICHRKPPVSEIGTPFWAYRIELV